MTNTAHEDQFAPDPTNGGWSTRDVLDAYTVGQLDERATIVKMLLKHGYRQIAHAIINGEHSREATKGSPTNLSVGTHGTG